MTDNFPFKDALTGEAFTVRPTEVYYLMSLENGTVIMKHDGTSHVVKATFAAVCRELNYCEA
jgi:DNA-binding LytR/AlgR family response regulator